MIVLLFNWVFLFLALCIKDIAIAKEVKSSDKEALQSTHKYANRIMSTTMNPYAPPSPLNEWWQYLNQKYLV